MPVVRLYHMSLRCYSRSKVNKCISIITFFSVLCGVILYLQMCFYQNKAKYDIIFIGETQNQKITNKIQDGRHILHFIRNCCKSYAHDQKIMKACLLVHSYNARQKNIKSWLKLFCMNGKIQDGRFKTINSFEIKAKTRHFG